MAVNKAICITEGNTIQSRVDATKIFNHQAPASGGMAIGSCQSISARSASVYLASSFDTPSSSSYGRSAIWMKGKVPAHLKPRFALISRSSESLNLF